MLCNLVTQGIKTPGKETSKKQIILNISQMKHLGSKKSISDETVHRLTISNHHNLSWPTFVSDVFFSATADLMQPNSLFAPLQQVVTSHIKHHHVLVSPKTALKGTSHTIHDSDLRIYETRLSTGLAYKGTWYDQKKYGRFKIKVRARVRSAGLSWHPCIQLCVLPVGYRIHYLLSSHGLYKQSPYYLSQAKCLSPT